MINITWFISLKDSMLKNIPVDVDSVKVFDI